MADRSEGARGYRAASRRLAVVAAVGITISQAIGPLTPNASAIEPSSQAEALPTVSPNGRVVQVAPAPITTPPGGGAPETDPTIGGAPIFLPYTPPVGTTEIAEQRTGRSRTLANPDGTFTTEVSAGPINFKDAAGNWQPIDLSLVGDPIEGYKVAATAGDVTLDDADGSLGAIEIDGHKVTVSPSEYLVGSKGEGVDINRLTFETFTNDPALWIRPVDVGTRVRRHVARAGPGQGREDARLHRRGGQACGLNRPADPATG